jgi:Family of unknown function (DUF6247)
MTSSHAGRSQVMGRPACTPAAIRAVLAANADAEVLPRYDKELDAAFEQARERGDLTPLLETVRRWWFEADAWSDPDSQREFLARVERYQREGPPSPAERTSWQEIRAQYGLFLSAALQGCALPILALGPAKIICTKLMLDGVRFGDFSRSSVDELRDELSIRPHATTLGGQPFLNTDYGEFLLSVDSYDPSQHRKFRELIELRLGIEIQYSSLYDERFTAVYGHMEEPRH